MLLTNCAHVKPQTINSKLRFIWKAEINRDKTERYKISFFPVGKHKQISLKMFIKNLNKYKPMVYFSNNSSY